jgi:hypothetical protein
VNIAVAALRSRFCTCALSSLIHWQATNANTRKADSVYVMFCACKMFKTIVRPADCEVWSVIHFLNARNVKPVDIHHQICEVYGETAMSDGKVRKWVRKFRGRHNTCDELRSCRPWSQAATFYKEGIQKLVPHDKCLNNGGNYVV